MYVAALTPGIGAQTSTHERFGSTVRALAAFFREKKQGAS